MRCEACQGERFRRRLIDASAIYGKPKMVSVSRVCEFCNGKGEVKEILAPSGKDKAANGTEEKELLFSS